MKIRGSNFVLVASVLTIVGCASVSDTSNAGKDIGVSETISIPPSYLKSGDSFTDQNEKPEASAGAPQVSPEAPSPKTREDRYLKPLDWSAKTIQQGASISEMLSASNQLSLAAEKMPLREFIHYVFGQLLGLNYVLDPSFEEGTDESGDSVTLSVANAISSREVFDLASQVLEGRGIGFKFASDTFFFFRDASGGGLGQVIIGFGRDKESVPKTAQKIMQVIPVKFGIKVFMERTLISLGGAKISPDFSQSTIIAEGTRDQILKVIELIDILDIPAARGQYIGLIELAYLAVDSFTQEVKVLLENEGIKASIGNAQNNNLVLVPLNQMSAVAVFSTDKFFIERLKYWASVIDIPSDGEGRQFYIYNPKYSRASDLEKSVSSLLGISSGALSSRSGETTGQAPAASRASTVGSDGIALAMDEKANALIFFATGQQYRDLLPLLKKLDVVPRQVMLDILIAEVSLKDEFKFGVEWAVARGEVNLTTQGAFGATTVGGIGLVVNGKEGPLQANTLATNSLVNVLSNPSLMVRAGTTATINVGSSISIVGSTTQDPINGDRETSSVEYKKTGVNITVDVNVNAVGIVAMDIQQNISNAVPGGSGAGGNPDLFERTLTTEVLAKSGQTVLLGGLISQNANRGGSGVPVLSRIPLIGSLFKSQSEASDRTELVMLVTPRVIDDLSSWDEVLQDFSRALRFLETPDS